MSSHSVQSTPPLSQSPAPLSPASSHGHHVSTTTATHLVNGQLAVQDPSSGPVRRKTSRRANTAERRATHNAVERQRRETLNSRFLDLAALLPNLAAVRRPSKSAIVNSSIALIHTQRRQRALAARELRIIKAETDALRAELNEWRGRNGHARVDEPPRTQEFLTLLTLEEVTAVEEEEIRRAYEMASIPVGDEDEDGYIDAPGMYTAEPAPMMPPQHHGAPVNMAPPPPPPPHINAPAPPTMHHHELQAQLHAAALLQSQAQGRSNVHIPAFDGPNIFPGPGHHAHHAQAPAAHHVPQQHQHAPAPQIPTQNMFPPQFNHPSPGAIGGSPPHPGHFQPYPPSQRSPQAYRDVNIYSREGAPAQFAHAPPLAPTQSLSGVRDDDSVSSSSGGGSPPATAGSFPSYASQQQGAAGADVPALAAGATPADFARFWAQASPTKVAAGFPMGFAM